jgi:phytoene dehydrogenase-like protein
VSGPDVVVIGAGVDGLACALTLARAGERVLVLEQRAEPGGLSARRTFAPGCAVPGVRHETGSLPAALAAELGLALQRAHVPVLALEREGRGLLLHSDPIAARAELAERSPRDAEAYAAFRARLSRARPLLERLVSRPPPPLLPRGTGDALRMGLTGLALRRLGREDLHELLRALPMCVADWMREQFETEVLSATLAFPAVAGDFVGPWSPGTAALLVLREALLEPGVAGGPAAVVDASVSALAAHGGALRTGARVARIRVEGRRVRGVVLAGGEDVACERVVAACSPRAALLELLPPLALDVRDTTAARAIRSRGTAAKVHLALREPAAWAARPGERFDHVRIGAHLDDLERAFDAVKYRKLPARPVLDVRASAAEPGHDAAEVLSVLVHAVPRDLDVGWTAPAHAALLDTVLAVLDQHAPGLRASVVASEVLTPADLEAEYGLPGGSLHHVERGLDQMLLRPARPFARHATPIEGLFLGSSGCHPGPAAIAMPGVLAARAALQTQISQSSPDSRTR